MFRSYLVSQWSGVKAHLGGALASAGAGPGQTGMATPGVGRRPAHQAPASMRGATPSWSRRLGWRRGPECEVWGLAECHHLPLVTGKGCTVTQPVHPSVSGASPPGGEWAGAPHPMT